MARQQRMINTKGALESLRNLGVTLDEGIGELVDNSIDAYSTKVGIHIEKKQGGNFRIIVADDGRGIPESVPGSPEIEDTVQHVLRFGGKIEHKASKFPIGVFGFGLSQTATCLTTRTMVFSKVEGGEWRSCEYSFEHLKRENAMLPPEERGKEPSSDELPPGWELGESGTVVVLDEVDKPGFKRPGHLANHIEHELGRIYRKQIGKGVVIEVSTDSEEAAKVTARDPMCQQPDSVEVEAFGAMPDKGKVSITLDGTDVKSLPRIEDPVTGEPAIVRVRLVMVDVERVYNHIGIEHGSTPNRSQQIALGKWGFNYAGQGFTILRNGREIRHGQSLGAFSKADGLNFFRASVEFPACLDDLFNVQVVKSRFTIDRRLKDAIGNRCQPTIAEIRSQTQDKRSSLSARRHPASIATAEERSGALRELVNRQEIPAEEHDEKRKRLEERKQEVIAEVDKEADEDIKHAEEDVDKAEKIQDAAAISKAEDRAKEVEQRASKRKKDVRNRFKVDAFCRKHIRPLRGGDLYMVEDFHDEIWVTINSESDFFRFMYERATQYAEQEALLDLMLFGIAYAEADRANSPEMAAFWSDVRRDVSRLSHILVSVEGFNGDGSSPGDVETDDSRTKQEEGGEDTLLSF